MFSIPIGEDGISFRGYCSMFGWDGASSYISNSKCNGSPISSQSHVYASNFSRSSDLTIDVSTTTNISGTTASGSPGGASLTTDRRVGSTNELRDFLSFGPLYFDSTPKSAGP
ncbi:hypothetical protein HAX54_036697 [Datura stramonium]|uniref:Uncharacterized protein n=1 Tax=Datura stramonium TaxID=4076 RepID=A0ABS8VH98_DATST|nr:hypothetical protein [Datura stramonium]